jgi:hypothetical protein
MTCTSTWTQSQILFTLGVQTGVEHMSGNMFESVPSGCDAFLMKVTIHNLFTAINSLVLTGFRRITLLS